ncbi:MAG: hypothetical protein ACJ72H_25460 [Candidatus Sulfotelmatobacter sp.]
MAEASEVVEQIAEQVKPEPETVPAEDMAAGGNQFDSEKNAFVNKTPRNEQGRFAKVRESLERSQKRSTYVKAVLEGAVEPDENTMDADTWAAARNAQIARGTSKITAPEFPAEKTGDEAEGAETQAVELTPAEIAHNSAHEELNVRLLARLETKEVKQLTSAMEFAARAGATPYFFDQLGHIAADHDNREAVLFHLGQNPEKLAAYSRLAPDQLKNVVHVLSQQLGAQEKAAAHPPKPKPPDPVGARASSTAFDVNDESIDADTWARQRNESLAKRRRN